MPSKLLQCRVILLCLGALPAMAQPQARVDQFSPQGTVKNVRQAHARFSEPMVPFGDPRSPDSPFVAQCSEKGAGRWVDGRNWVFDFDRNLPAGIRCEFRLRDGLRTLAGGLVSGPQRFAFSTGGPAILSSRPWEGSDYVDEEQVFLLELDSEASEQSVLANTSFTVEKLPDRIGVRIVTGEQRDAILKAEFPRAEHRPAHTLLIQAVRRLPAGARVSLVWGRGVSTPGGVATETDQVLPFVVRTPFTATFHCQRENPQAECVPVSPMRLSFSAPVLWTDVRDAVLKGPGGKRWSPKPPGPDEEEDSRFVTDLSFEGPFPERSSFSIEIPAGLKDDSGRSLSNSGAFPVTVRTDEYPPLAKFSSHFGILEWKGSPVLPVTLRNVEPTVAGRSMQVTGGERDVDPPEPNAAELPVAGSLRGRVLRVPTEQAGQMMHWIAKVRGRSWEDRDKSVFGPVTKEKAGSFTIPKPGGGKAFEVVGIPMKAPGFYVVEIESEILGAALLGPAQADVRTDDGAGHEPLRPFQAGSRIVARLGHHAGQGSSGRGRNRRDHRLHGSPALAGQDRPRRHRASRRDPRAGTPVSGVRRGRRRAGAHGDGPARVRHGLRPHNLERGDRALEIPDSHGVRRQPRRRTHGFRPAALPGRRNRAHEAFPTQARHGGLLPDAPGGAARPRAHQPPRHQPAVSPRAQVGCRRDRGVLLDHTPGGQAGRVPGRAGRGADPAARPVRPPSTMQECSGSRSIASRSCAASSGPRRVPSSPRSRFPST